MTALKVNGIQERYRNLSICPNYLLKHILMETYKHEDGTGEANIQMSDQE
jgi:hypothetical protein